MELLSPAFSVGHCERSHTLLSEKTLRPIELNANGCRRLCWIGNGSHSKVNVQIFLFFSLRLLRGWLAFGRSFGSRTFRIIKIPAETRWNRPDWRAGATWKGVIIGIMAGILIRTDDSSERMRRGSFGKSVNGAVLQIQAFTWINFVIDPGGMVGWTLGE